MNRFSIIFLVGVVAISLATLGLAHLDQAIRKEYAAWRQQTAEATCRHEREKEAKEAKLLKELTDAYDRERTKVCKERNLTIIVERSDVDRLRTRLSKIRDMSKEELKVLYKEQLRAEPEQGSKGAGLGLMEIARRATKPIEFDFTEVDSDYAFFALKATI